MAARAKNKTFLAKQFAHATAHAISRAEKGRAGKRAVRSWSNV